MVCSYHALSFKLGAHRLLTTFQNCMPNLLTLRSCIMTCKYLAQLLCSKYSKSPTDRAHTVTTRSHQVRCDILRPAYASNFLLQPHIVLSVAGSFYGGSPRHHKALELPVHSHLQHSCSCHRRLGGSIYGTNEVDHVWANSYTPVIRCVPLWFLFRI